MLFASGMKEAIEKHASFADQAEAAAYWASGAEDVMRHDFTYIGADGQPQEARLYSSNQSAGAPVLLYIHGGGWTGGSIIANEWSACSIAASSGWNVLSISYRLSPEHPFPAGLNDCYAALTWLREAGSELGLDINRVALGGASAGANLALATALMDEPDQLMGLLLFYGVFGCDFNTESYLNYADGPGLTRARMQELFELYDPGGLRNTTPKISPLLSGQLSGLPSSLLIAAEHDVLLDDSKSMSKALTESGAATQFYIELGVTHGYINRGRMVPSANLSLARAAKFLDELITQKASS